MTFFSSISSVVVEARDGDEANESARGEYGGGTTTGYGKTGVADMRNGLSLREMELAQLEQQHRELGTNLDDLVARFSCIWRTHGTRVATAIAAAR